MFRNMGLHVIEFPTGRFGYVGSIPAALGNLEPAGTADIMAGRVHGTIGGKPATLKFPTFPDRDSAIQFATDRGERVAYHCPHCQCSGGHTDDCPTPHATFSDD